MSMIDEREHDTLDDLPIEEDDVTATEQHQALVNLLKVGLEWRFMGRALVLDDIFVAIGRKQVAPDVLVRFGAEPGQRNRYVVEVEGVPEVTIEILSTVNHTTEGLILLQQKRNLLGEIGVSEHIEIDPTTATIQVWTSSHGLNRSVYVGKEWRSEVVGVRFRFDDQRFEAIDDAGRTFETPAHALARANAEQERANAEQERANAEQERADTQQERANTQQERADTQQERANTQQERANTEQERADTQQERAERFRLLLEAHGIDAVE